MIGCCAHCALWFPFAIVRVGAPPTNSHTKIDHSEWKVIGLEIWPPTFCFASETGPAGQVVNQHKSLLYSTWFFKFLTGQHGLGLVLWGIISWISGSLPRHSWPGYIIYWRGRLLFLGHCNVMTDTTHCIFTRSSFIK